MGFISGVAKVVDGIGGITNTVSSVSNKVFSLGSKVVSSKIGKLAIGTGALYVLSHNDGLGTITDAFKNLLNAVTGSAKGVIEKGLNKFQDMVENTDELANEVSLETMGHTLEEGVEKAAQNYESDKNENHYDEQKNQDEAEQVQESDETENYDAEMA